MGKLIDIIVGARPNFIKVAAIIRELQAKKTANLEVNFRLIHTSQHYDTKMSGIFFEELNIPKPDINLNVGHIEASKQIATIISRYSAVLEDCRPDMVIVSGDVNSTVACALASKKSDATIPLVHVEAGLRCGDKQMPEEINRILTDAISDYFFTTSISASDNLINEGVLPNKIFFVGNTMIDTLYNNEKRFKKPNFWNDYDLCNKNYYVLTLHRQANISDAKTLNNLLQVVCDAAGDTPVVFPVHPHTEKLIRNFGIIVSSNMIMTEPMGYLEFNYLVKNAKAVITDSGGISEETTIMNVPCMTLRNNTERPETCSVGTNVLLGNCATHIHSAFERLNSGQWQIGKNPKLWDGKSASRIVEIVYNILLQRDLDNHKAYKNKAKISNSIKSSAIFLN